MTFDVLKCKICARRKIMAESKKTKKSSSSQSSKGSIWSLNKISFWTIVAVTVLYAVSLILSAVGVNLKIVGALQGVATAIMIIIVSILAWRFVRSKPFVWKILYVICLLIVLAGIVVPLV